MTWSIIARDTGEFGSTWEQKAVGVCDEASTLRTLDNCEDELAKVSDRFYKQ